MPQKNLESYPCPVESTVFKDAPPEAAFRVLVTKFEGQDLESVIFPELDEAAQLLVKSRYQAARIIGDQEDIPYPSNFERHIVVQKHPLYPDELIIPVATACLLLANANDLLPTSKMDPTWPPNTANILNTNAIEPGRLTSFHPSRIVQRLGFLALARSALGYIAGAEIPLLVFHTEQPAITTLKEFGLPLVQAEPVSIQEARPAPTTLIPAFLEYATLLQKIAEQPESDIAKFFSGINMHLGLDWYDSNMMPISNKQGGQALVPSYPFPFN